MTVFGKRFTTNGLVTIVTDDYIVMASQLFGFWKKYAIGDTLFSGRIFTERMFSDVKAEAENATTGTWTFDDNLEMGKRA